MSNQEQIARDSTASANSRPIRQVATRWSTRPIAALAFGITIVLLGVAAAPASQVATDADAEAEEPTSTEVLLLGKFRIRELRAIEGTTLRIAFSAYTVVPADQSHAIRGLMETHRHRVRDAIITAVRMCEQHDFQQPGLERFRRRIWLRLNQTNPELQVSRVLIGSFEFLTQ